MSRRAIQKYSKKLKKTTETCSRGTKIKTKDDTNKFPLKSNQSIIQLHNSTVTVNKKRQKGAKVHETVRF